MKYLKLLFLLSFIVLLLIPISNVDARRGCCSWHGGVCGCGSNGRTICCDGTYSPTCTCGYYEPSPSLPSYTIKSYQYVAGCSIWAETFDEVNNINNIYREIRGNNARCDELDFHVQHVTPHDVLRNWLTETLGIKVLSASVVNVNVGDLEGKTILDRSNGKLYLIKDGARHWAPDVLTMASHGLIYEDGIVLENYQVSSIVLGYQLKYWEGKYYRTIEVVLREGNKEAIRFLPARLNEEVEKLADRALNWRGVNQILGR